MYSFVQLGPSPFCQPNQHTHCGGHLCSLHLLEVFQPGFSLLSLFFQSFISSYLCQHHLHDLLLIQPVISQLEQNAKIVPLKSNNVIKAKFFQLASIAAIIAIVSAFSFYRIDEDKPNVVDIKTPASKEVLNIKIPTITLTLTEAEIEKSLEENYQNLSQSATEKWKATTTNFARATEYIANGTHYISAKYLNPINNESTGPQS